MHRTRWFKFHTEEMKYILLKIVKRDLQRKPLFFFEQSAAQALHTVRNLLVVMVLLSRGV